jgi:DNA primase
VELAKPLLSKLQPGVLRQMMLEKLGELAQLGTDKLAVGLNKPIAENSSHRQFPKDVAGPKEPPSLMRRAVALLLQYPVLAARVPAEITGGALSQLPGVEVFQAVLTLTTGRPGLNTGAILEAFRGSEHETVVEKLAFMADPAIDRAVEPEFDDLVLKIQEEARHLKVESLRQKQNPTPEEKAELARLLSKKGKSGNFLHDH